jgi:penicillin-binding protein 1A
MSGGPSLEDRDPRRAGRSSGRTGAGKTSGKTSGSGRGGGTGSGARRTSSGRRGAGAARVLVVLKALLWAGVCAGFLAAAVLVGMFSYYGSDPKLPTLKALGDYHPKQVTRVVDRNGTVIGELGAEKRTVVPYSSIPKILIDGVISAEDADYFHHTGVDYRGMVRAFIENVLRGRTAQGGSTITQQVVKALLLSPERTMRRKVQEIILARQLAQKLTKEEVLALYLNQIYYGHGRYGCEEAARYFFGKSVRDINVAEAALLAGLPQSPERLSPRKHPEAAKTRQRYVLGRMAENGFIDQATAAKLAAEPIRLARDTSPSRGLAGEAVDGVGRFLTERYGERAAFDLGTTVSTTIDARLQELARRSLERGLEELDVRQGFRGPSGHLAGKALDRRRAELAAAHGGAPRDQAIIEGIVDYVERPEAREDKPAGAGGKPAQGRIVVDVGGAEGVVDLNLEPRYTKGPKPLVDRFSPGDLIRVRVASERPRPEPVAAPAPPPPPKALPPKAVAARRAKNGKAGGAAAAVAPPPSEAPAPRSPPTLALALELGPQAAMVVLDPATRQILALVGGYEFHSGGLDRSRSARRQPGSSFKPIYFSTAIEQHKITAATVINDSPEVYDLWKPQNHGKDFLGPIRIRTALARSINTVAIKVMNEIGVNEGAATAERFGLTPPPADKRGLSLALGALEATPLEMAGAYGVLAGGGQRRDPWLVRGVGSEAIEPKPFTPLIKPETAYVVTSLMRSVIDEGTAHAAAGKLRRPAAGKTGTTDSEKDAWFVGYTPDLLAAVWVGFDDNKVLGHGEEGARTALPIWLDFMTKAVVGRPTKDFAAPPGVVIQRVDKATGLLPAPGQDTNTIDEVFLADTVPTEQAPAGGEENSADKLLLDQQ